MNGFQQNWSKINWSVCFFSHVGKKHSENGSVTLCRALSSSGLYLRRNHLGASCNHGWPSSSVNYIDYFDLESVLVPEFEFPDLYIHVFLSSSDSCSCVRGPWLYPLAEASLLSSPTNRYQRTLCLFQNSTLQVFRVLTFNLHTESPVYRVPMVYT